MLRMVGPSKKRLPGLRTFMKEDELSLENPKVRDMIYFLKFILEDEAKKRARRRAYHKTIRQKHHTTIRP